MFLDRYLVFVSIAYYLLIANSIEIIGRKRWTFFLTATVAIGSMILTFKPNVDNKRRMREAVQTINSFKTKESANSGLGNASLTVTSLFPLISTLSIS